MKINLKKLIRLFLFTAIALSAIRLVAMESVPQQIPAPAFNWNYWKVMLLNRQREALSLAHRVKAEFTQRRDKITRGNRYCDYEQKCPFFMLDECDNQACPLYRGKGFREPFEKYVSDKLVDIIDKKSATNEPVYYLGFASGSLFSDFRIVAMALNQRPKAHIVMRCFDPGYYWGIEDWRFLNVLIEQANICAKFQFKASIRHMFPDAKFDLKLIDSYKMSAADIVKDFKNKLDIMVMIDVNEGLVLWAELLGKLLIIHKDINNFALMKCFDKEGVYSGIIEAGEIQRKLVYDLTAFSTK